MRLSSTVALAAGGVRRTRAVVHEVLGRSAIPRAGGLSVPGFGPTEPRMVSRRSVVVTGRFLTSALVAAVASTGLPAPARVPAAPEVQQETIDLAVGASGPRGAAGGTRTGAAAPGWSTRVGTSFPPQLVGFTWKGAPRGAVEVRGRAGGGWTPWFDVHANPDEAPDPGTGEGGGSTAAGPVWLGDGVDSVEVRVEDGRLRDLRMEAIRSIEPAGGGFGISGAGAVRGGPGIVPRSAWGASGWGSGNRGCGSGPRYATPRFGVVHHTVNGNGYGPDQSDDLLRGIQAFHIRTNGWCDIAYNFLVDRYGRVFEGRAGGIDRGPMGGHTKGFNEGAVGVALLGDFSAAAVPTAMRSGLRSLLSWKFGLHGIDAGADTVEVSGGSTKFPAGQSVRLPRLFGHRDVSLTACPGQFAYPLLPALRQELRSDVGLLPYTGPHLRRGSRGQQVVIWQFLLVAVHGARISADGAYGPQTERATKAFQRSRGIRATGGVGPKTIAAMNGAVAWINAHR
jgi:hypothetical protein